MDSLELRRKNFIPKEDFPAEVAIGVIYDSGDYDGRAGQAAREPRPRRLPARAGGAARAGHLPRRRVLDLHGDLRPRAVARGRAAGRRPPGRLLGVRGRARAPVRLGDRLHRQLAARPGARDRLRPDRGRPASASRPSRSRSSTPTPTRARTAWARTARARWRSAASRRRGRPNKVADKAKKIVAHLLEAAPEDIELADGKYQVRGSPEKAHDAWPRWPARPTSPRTCPRAWSPGWRRSTSTTRRTSSGRSARTRAWSTWTSTTGKVKVVRYVPWTTAARRSTRC